MCERSKSLYKMKTVYAISFLGVSQSDDGSSKSTLQHCGRHRCKVYPRRKATRTAAISVKADGKEKPAVSRHLETTELVGQSAAARTRGRRTGRPRAAGRPSALPQVP